MPPKKRRASASQIRTHSWESDGQPAQASRERPESSSDQDVRFRREEFGKMLENRLVKECALGRLSAKSLCVLAFLAVQSGS
eukprot:527923-Pyramimonas_sp.AAC.1